MKQEIACAAKEVAELIGESRKVIELTIEVKCRRDRVRPPFADSSEHFAWMAQSFSHQWTCGNWKMICLTEVTPLLQDTINQTMLVAFLLGIPQAECRFWHQQIMRETD